MATYPSVPERTLASLRIAAGLTQDALGKASGVSGVQIGRYERGAQPTLPVAVRMARALGITVDELNDVIATETVPAAA